MVMDMWTDKNTSLVENNLGQYNVGWLSSFITVVTGLEIRL
jgi:hypothetical protein